MKQKYHLVSFSGGKDSTAMFLHMMELGIKIVTEIYVITVIYVMHKVIQENISKV